MLILEGLPLHIFLTSQTFFICLSALLPHLLFLSELLLIALQLELHLVLSLALFHLLLILDSLSLLFFLHLCFLDAKLPVERDEKLDQFAPSIC